MSHTAESTNTSASGTERNHSTDISVGGFTPRRTGSDDRRRRTVMSNHLDLLRRARELLLDGKHQQAVALLRENVPALDREAVGIIADLDATTITRYVGWSDDGGRYADDPFPAPTSSIDPSPVWAVERAPELLAWRDRHANHGAGRRRPFPEKAATPANAAAKPSRGKRSSE
jgi:hypothetical protein